MKRIFIAGFVAACMLMMASSVFALNVVEDSKFKVGLFLGWDVLDQERRYVFDEISSFWDDESPDFFWEQHNWVDNQSKRSYNYDEIYDAFAEKFTPVLISILPKDDFDSLAIFDISTPSVTFRGETSKAGITSMALYPSRLVHTTLSKCPRKPCMKCSSCYPQA